MFIPFRQKGHIVDTNPLKKKLDVRAIQAQYLRALGPDLLLVWKTDRKKIATMRGNEFILSQHTRKSKQNEKSLFEQATDLPRNDNTAYDYWYADWILHSTNTRGKARKVGNQRKLAKK